MTTHPPMLLIVLMLVGAYITVTSVMRVLAAHFHREKSVHDLVRMAKQAKLDYYRELAIRKGLIPDDESGNVIIEGEGPEDLALEDDTDPVAKIGPDGSAAKQAA